MFSVNSVKSLHQVRDQEVGGSNPLAPTKKQIRRLENLVSNRRFAIVPNFVPTPDHVLRGVYRVGRGGRRLRAGLAVPGALDGFLDRLHLRVDVAACRGEVAVSGEVA